MGSSSYSEEISTVFQVVPRTPSVIVLVEHHVCFHVFDKLEELVAFKSSSCSIPCPAYHVCQLLASWLRLALKEKHNSTAFQNCLSGICSNLTCSASGSKRNSWQTRRKLNKKHQALVLVHVLQEGLQGRIQGSTHVHSYQGCEPNAHNPCEYWRSKSIRASKSYD